MLHDEDTFCRAIENCVADDQPHQPHAQALRARLLDLFESHEQQPTRPRFIRLVHQFGRAIVNNKRQSIAAAAAVLLVVGASLIATLWHQSVAMAYTIDQTVEANRGLRHAHVRFTDTARGAERVIEQWIEFDDAGKLSRMRIELQSGPEPHVVVIDRGTMKTWTPARNTFSIEDCNMSQLVSRLLVASEYTNPKVAMDILRRLEADGQIRIEVKNPQGPGEPITLVTTPAEQPLHGAPARCVLQIDPQTKLLREKEVYWLAGNETKDWKRTEYLDYDQPDPAKFLLEPPAGAKVTDRANGMGIPQGNLTDAEAAAAVARRFFEALIAEDHQEFERLYIGPAKRGWYGKDRKWVRIVSIGAPLPFQPPVGLPTPQMPVPPKDTASRQYRVPYEVEFEEAGVSQVIRSVPIQSARGPYVPHLRVRPLSSQPDHWVVE